VGSFGQEPVLEQDFSELVSINTVASFEFQTLEKTSGSDFFDQWTL
tara:strand:+ start:80 stop:217 length:138 start_codon:yes stop_codon:yes gene_type:complete